MSHLKFIIPLYDVAYYGALILRRSVTRRAMSRSAVFVHIAEVWVKVCQTPLDNIDWCSGCANTASVSIFDTQQFSSSRVQTDGPL